jgi:hypothetical protein
MKILSGEVGGHRGEIRIGAPAKFARRWMPSVPAWR